MKRHTDYRKDLRDITIAAISETVQQKDWNPRYVEVVREDRNKVE